MLDAEPSTSTASGCSTRVSRVIAGVPPAMVACPQGSTPVCPRAWSLFYLCSPAVLAFVTPKFDEGGPVTAGLRPAFWPLKSGKVRPEANTHKYDEYDYK